MKAPLLFLTAACVWGAAVRGQNHPLTDLAPPLEGVSTEWWLPEFPEKQFPAGKVVESVVGVRNGADDIVNITAICGSLNNPAAFNQFWQNFSYQPQSIIIAPGQEASLSYHFFPDPSLPPREFQVALTVFYHTDGGNFSQTYFNQTIDIVEVPPLIDIQGFFLFVALLGVLAAIAYGIYSALQWKGVIKTKRPAKKKVEVKKATAESQEEWLKGTYYNKGGSKKVPVAKGKIVTKVEEPVAVEEVKKAK